MTIKNEDILSYNPDLIINTRSEIEFNSENAYEKSDFKSNRSLILNEFELHKPSSKIEKFIQVDEVIESFKENIKNKLQGTEMAVSYFNAETEAEKEEVLNENYNDMVNGSTLIETYSALENIKIELSLVKDDFIISIYGKDVDIDKVLEIDDAYINKLDSHEFNGEHEYINYFNLYYDTQISYLMGEYAYKMENIVTNLGIIEEKNYESKADKSAENVLRYSFDKNNELLHFDLYKNNENSKELQIALKNVFITKYDLNMYYDSFYDLSSIGDEFEIIHEVGQDNIKNLNEKMDNLVKTVMMSELSKNDICSTLVKKSNIRGFFAM